MPKPIIRTKQSPATLVGCCYGYSSFWARGKLNLPDREQGLSDQAATHEIPLTNELFKEQWSQIIPNGSKRLAKFYIDYWNKNDLVDDIKKGLTNVGDACLIGYAGAIGGHSLAIKKVSEDTYQYFDSNVGVYEFEGTELDKLFSDYIHPFYKKIFYGLTLEYIQPNDFSPDLLENCMATAYIVACKIISTPVGIFKYLESLCALIHNLVSNQKLDSNIAQPSESTPLRV